MIYFRMSEYQSGLHAYQSSHRYIRANYHLRWVCLGSGFESTRLLTRHSRRYKSEQFIAFVCTCAHMHQIRGNNADLHCPYASGVRHLLCGAFSTNLHVDIQVNRVPISYSPSLGLGLLRAYTLLTHQMSKRDPLRT